MTFPHTTNDNTTNTSPINSDQPRRAISKRTRLPSLIAASAIAMILTACGASSADSAEVSADLTEFNDNFNETAENYDVDALVSLYADDALWIAPGTAPAPGQELASQTFQFLANNRGFLSHTIEQLIISDDGTQAVMVGEADVLVEDAGLDVTGTYLFVLERDGDDWNIAVDMFNQYTPNNTEQAE